MEVWDPIGVNGIPQAADEYDNYVGKAYAMMMDDGASASEIAVYLHWVASEYMGLSGVDPALSKRTANALFALRRDFKEDLARLHQQSEQGGR